MMRAAALAACLLALAAGASAAKFYAVSDCTPGHVKLEYVAPKLNQDPMARCLTSVMVNLTGACEIIVTPLQSAGSHVPGFYTTIPILTSGDYILQTLEPGEGDCPSTGGPCETYKAGVQNKRWVECPTGPSAPVPALSSFASITPGEHLEAIRRALILALESFVYGMNTDDLPNYRLPVSDLDFHPGLVFVKRGIECDVRSVDAAAGASLFPIGAGKYSPADLFANDAYGEYSLMYAITESTINPEDFLLDDDLTALSVVSSCEDLVWPTAPYDEAAILCRVNDEADLACPENSYAVMVVPDLNEDDEKDTAFKVCGLCPTGTAGKGFGCTTCPAGSFSEIGGDCSLCPPGTYSNAGSSVCISCPTGTYADTAGLTECKECPEDSYSWIPGAVACLRCIAGVPEVCENGVCPSGVPLPNKPKSSPATAIAAVMSMGSYTTSSGPGCPLAGPFEIPAYTKCEGWGEGTGPAGASPLQLAFRVAGDCSIQISPIGDPTCAMPRDPRTNPDNEDPDVYDETVYPYGKIEMRGYYTWDPTTKTFSIRSLFNVQVDDHPVQDAGLMLSVDATPGPGDGPRGEKLLVMGFFGATTNPAKAQEYPIVYDPPSSPTLCLTQLVHVGGSLLGNVVNNCPPGTYFHAVEGCPACPVGHTCPGTAREEANDPELGLVVPCPAGTYNPILGFAGEECPSCIADIRPTATEGPQFTSYAGAEWCSVEALDLQCDDVLLYQDEGSFAYDVASQQCQRCAAGTFRPYGDSLECELCPAGTYSAEGDKECTPCPAGQYSPVAGLPDQESIAGDGIHCMLCAEGSVALRVFESGIDTPAGAGMDTATATIGAEFLDTGCAVCDACPAGTFQPAFDAPCTVCEGDSWRAGDATPENNVCKPIPAGFKLKVSEDPEFIPQSAIELCPKGQVSYYRPGGARVPTESPLECIPCAALDKALNLDPPQWAHTFAHRMGMTQCIPCPAGTVPFTNGEVEPDQVADFGTTATATCKVCPNGFYRDTKTISATCLDCPAGKEVGPSSKMACEACRPGSYMDVERAASEDNISNTCALCLKNYYRPTFGALSCLPCPRGTQTTNIGNVECTACPVGYLNNKAGTDCAAAPRGTFVNTTGAYVSTPCPKGTWNNEEAQDNCNPCAPGKYSNNLGSTECKTCAAGTYSAGQSSGCGDCRPGYFAPAGAAACSPCKPGSYAPAGKSATCKLCPKGYQCPTNAMKAVGPCPRGTFSNKEGNKQCTPCPINTYSNGGGLVANPTAVMACIKCQPGTNTRGLVGQSKCQVIRPQVKRLF